MISVSRICGKDSSGESLDDEDDRKRKRSLSCPTLYEVLCTLYEENNFFDQCKSVSLIPFSPIGILIGENGMAIVISLILSLRETFLSLCVLEMCIRNVY